MKLSEVFSDINSDIKIKGITIDSRRVSSGYLYVCIEGLRVDGHSFAIDAIKNGATALVCRKGFSLPDEYKDIVLIYSDNPRLDLSLACSKFYNSPTQGMTTIGITGTNGKSSVVHFISQALERLTGDKVGTIGTLGAGINGSSVNIPYATSTTPDTVELYEILSHMREEGVKYLVMEVTSHALALEKVSHILFQYGIFTNLTQDHLDFHGTFENYRLAKARLFDLCEKGIINIDDNSAEFLKDYAKCGMLGYSINNPSEYQAYNASFDSDGIKYEIDNQILNIPITGKFNIYNTLCTYAILSDMGFGQKDIKNALEKAIGIPGRIQRVNAPSDITVIVDYAHTPDGLENIISSCREFAKGRIITVFGAGGDRDKGKRPLMGTIVGKLSDICIITSDNPRNEEPMSIINDIIEGIHSQYTAIVDRKEAIEFAIQQAQKDDIIIIAGKGHENYQEFENGRREHFSDMEVAEHYFSKINIECPNSRRIYETTKYKRNSHSRKRYIKQ